MHNTICVAYNVKPTSDGTQSFIQLTEHTATDVILCLNQET